MWNNLRKPLFALSLGLNLAFIAMWLVHSLSAPGDAGDLSRPEIDGSVPSVLHREIGVTEEQWRKIEPLVLDFREKAGKQRQQISALQGQLMDLLTMPEVDEAAIRKTQEEILAGQRRMQNLVIDHLLKEKEFLSPEQGKRLMQSLCEQCRQNGGLPSGEGHARFLMRD
ncbi:MAG: periplasmic heavy metal sensor [Deltaproteobacteria bacterium]|nr:periplasmic heavy metal sensor [Deltaproteobacteria bacterium]